MTWPAIGNSDIYLDDQGLSEVGQVRRERGVVAALRKRGGVVVGVAHSDPELCGSPLSSAIVVVGFHHEDVLRHGLPVETF